MTVLDNVCDALWGSSATTLRGSSMVKSFVLLEFCAQPQWRGQPPLHSHLSTGGKVFKKKWNQSCCQLFWLLWTSSNHATKNPMVHGIGNVRAVGPIGSREMCWAAGPNSKYISPGFVFTENVQVNGAYVCKKMAQTMYAGNRLEARGKSTKASWLKYACGCPKIKNCEMVWVAMANWEQCVYSRLASVKRSVGETWTYSQQNTDNW